MTRRPRPGGLLALRDAWFRCGNWCTGSIVRMHVAYVKEVRRRYGGFSSAGDLLALRNVSRARVWPKGLRWRNDENYIAWNAYKEMVRRRHPHYRRTHGPRS